MSLFLLTFFMIYGGMHAYAFLRVRSALSLGNGVAAVLATFMVCMTVAPLLVRVLERQGAETAARTLAWAGYLWMAFLFLFLCSTLLFDLVNLIFRGVNRLSVQGYSIPLMPARIAAIVSLTLALLISFYGYFEAWNVRTEWIRIETTKLPAGTDKLTIVQISDVHLGLILRCDRMEKIIAAVNAAKPDIFVSTGDLVDAQINHLTGLAELLRSVKPRYGSYAVTGNHEYYAGLDRALQFTQEAGFTLLRGRGMDIGPIIIAGVDDETGAQMGIEKAAVEQDILAKLPRNKFTLLLKHRPRLDQASSGFFDLQLSGHTHRGQIFPFRYVSRIAYPLNAGWYDLPHGAVLYTSRGTGTWGPPIRFLAPPEVTVVELVRKRAM